MSAPPRSPLAILKAALHAGDDSTPGQRLFDIHDLRLKHRSLNEQFIRGACDNAYLGRNTALCRVLGRYKAYVDTTDATLCSHLMLDGYWEMWVTETLCDLVRPGMVVADIGANVGYFTLLMADLVGPGGRVHAFEPNPRLAELASQSLLVNGFSDRVSFHQTALGDQNGQSVMLVVPPLTPMNAYILPFDADEPSDGVPVNVPITRLDSRTDWQAIELAKIDVEGAEELIWSGARGLLDNGSLRTVVLEFKANRYGDPAAFLERLCATGFALSHLTPNEGLISTNVASILGQPDSEDIILVLRR